MRQVKRMSLPLAKNPSPIKSTMWNFGGTSILTLEIGSGFSETAGVIRTVIPDFWQNISTTKKCLCGRLDMTTI